VPGGLHPPLALKAEAPSPERKQRDVLGQIEERNQRATEQSSLWRTPLTYFGKVVDESDNPVPGARASYRGNSLDATLTQEASNEGAVTSDQRGIFKIEGLYGIGLMIEVTHPDYYSYPTNSTGFDVRSLPRKGFFSDNEEQAEVFRMHHKGAPVPLLKHSGGLHTPADGTVASFPFRGATSSEIIGQGRVSGWKKPADPQTDGHYDWAVEISIPEGGIAESADYFGFVAPQEGYSETFRISMSKNDPDWKSHVEKGLFFKLPNHFVRAKVSVDLYHDLFFSMDYAVNPDGSRNLEPAP
jgi:hypothetical protein